VVNTSGYHRQRTTYDDFGQTIEQAWFGIQDEPVVNTDSEFGAARYVWKYDADGNVFERLRFGPDGALMNGPGGWAREVITRDPVTSKVSKTTHYAADGTEMPEPASAPEAEASVN
jgi:hypothetical protein